jgi:hypothetical protein
LQRPHFFERIGGVATATVGAKFIVVHIIRTMAAAAATVDCLHFAKSAPMTIIAGDIDVSTAQFKFGLQVVIKKPKIPRDWIVAGVATPGEVVAMWIVICMAVGTAIVRVREQFGLVTVLAFILVVNAKQRKGSEVVIEENRVLPGDFRVTAFTQRTERALV